MDVCILAGKGERSNNKKVLGQDQDQALECPSYVYAFTEGHRQGPIVQGHRQGPIVQYRQRCWRILCTL